MLILLYHNFEIKSIDSNGSGCEALKKSIKNPKKDTILLRGMEAQDWDEFL